MADIKIIPLPNGPYFVSGLVKLADAKGNEFTVKNGKVLLCRNGGSKSKPFCDVTHIKIKFQAHTKATSKANSNP